MMTLLVVLSVAAVCGLAWLVAKVFRVSLYKSILGFGVVGVVGPTAWGAIKLQDVYDGSGCSICVVSPRGAVILVAAYGAGIGLLVCLMGIVLKVAMAPPRRAAPPVKPDSTSVE